MPAFISIDKVTKDKPAATPQGISMIRALDSVSLNIEKGEIVALLGPSGAGKSTLLRLLNRMEDPNTGNIYLDGQNLKSIPIVKLRKKIGMVFQIPAMFEGTVDDNIQFCRRVDKSGNNDGIKPSEYFLHAVGLPEDFASRPANSLSVGQQQRVSIARTLAANPEVLLLDEPTASLDPSSANDILMLIRNLIRSTGLTTIIVTHVIEHARSVAERVTFLNAGKIVEDCTAEAFFRLPSTEEGRRYLSGLSLKEGEGSSWAT